MPTSSQGAVSSNLTSLNVTSSSASSSVAVTLNSSDTSSLPSGSASSSESQIVPVSSLAASSASGGTSRTSTSSSSPSASVSTADMICSIIQGEIIRTSAGETFTATCNTNHLGVVIEVTLAKRQTSAAASIVDCINECASYSGCVGTAFNKQLETCTLYSEIGDAYADDNVDFAIVVPKNSTTTYSKGQTVTKTFYNTVTSVVPCSASASDIPAEQGSAIASVAISQNNSTITKVIAVSSTTYVCPEESISTFLPTVCQCSYKTSTAVIYSLASTADSSSLVPITAQVLVVPQPAILASATHTEVLYQTVEPIGSVTDNSLTQESDYSEVISVTDYSSTLVEQQESSAQVQTLGASPTFGASNSNGSDAPVLEIADDSIDGVSIEDQTSSVAAVASENSSVVDLTEIVSTSYDFLPTMAVTFTDISVIKPIASASTKDDSISTTPVASEPHLTAQFVDATKTPTVTATLKTVPGASNSTTASRPALANDALQATYGGGIVIFVFSLLFLL